MFIDVIFHIMSAQIIESHRTEEFGFTLMSVYFVPLAKRLIMTYRILVNKHERIVLSNEIVPKRINVMIFDGPGFLSSVAFLQKERINISTTTFQCVIQVIHHEYKKHETIFSPIDYLAQPMEKKHIHVKSKAEIVHFPGNSCNETSCIFVLSLHSKQNVYFNATIFQFSYEGQPSSKCYFGGFAFFDFASEMVRFTVHLFWSLKKYQLRRGCGKCYFLGSFLILCQEKIIFPSLVQ